MSKRPQVLCIDDDPSILTIRKMVLESCGYTTLFALSGEEGLKILASQSVDAVLVDYMMPGMDGAKVAAEIKKWSPRTPVIMISAHESARNYVLNVADSFIGKGGAPETLLDRLAALIRLRNHSHSELQSECVVFVDASRRYLDCSDGACSLLGYSRLEMLEKTIDELSFHSERTKELFEKYLERGQEDGDYVLKHRQGHPIFIRYRAYTFPDGCIAAVWNPYRPTKETTALVS